MTIPRCIRRGLEDGWTTRRIVENYDVTQYDVLRARMELGATCPDAEANMRAMGVDLMRAQGLVTAYGPTQAARRLGVDVPRFKFLCRQGAVLYEPRPTYDPAMAAKLRRRCVKLELQQWGSSLRRKYVEMLLREGYAPRVVAEALDLTARRVRQIRRAMEAA